MRTVRKFAASDGCAHSLLKLYVMSGPKQV
jgi:hypothetical protein